LRLRFDSRALYAVLEANNGEELPAKHAFGDAPVRVMPEAEFEAWWSDLRISVAAGDVARPLGALLPLAVVAKNCQLYSKPLVAPFQP
jgi:hypothetical protein